MRATTDFSSKVNTQKIVNLREIRGRLRVMQITRIFTGDDGQSHFEELEIPSTDLGPPRGETVSYTHLTLPTKA